MSLAPSSPEIAYKSTTSAAKLSMILNQHSDQDLSVSGAATGINSPGTLRADTSSSTDTSSTSSVKRQKIEMAISELNLDEDVIRDLKDAFNYSSSSTLDLGSDAASALLGLRGSARESSPKASPTGTTAQFDKKAQKMQIRMHPYYAATAASLPSHKTVMAYPSKLVRTASGSSSNGQTPHLIPVHLHQTPHRSSFVPVPVPQSSVSRHPFPPPPSSQIRRVKEFTSFAIKLRQNKKYWEISAYSPEFEERQVKIKLAKTPPKDQEEKETETVIIEASKFMLIRCANGSVIEKSVSAQSVIPLGGLAVPNSISISCIRRGYVRIRIEKQR